jgi:hypothetical protein
MALGPAQEALQYCHQFIALDSTFWENRWNLTLLLAPLAGIEDEVEGSLKDRSGKALIPVFYLKLHIFHYTL